MGLASTQHDVLYSLEIQEGQNFRCSQPIWSLSCLVVEEQPAARGIQSVGHAMGSQGDPALVGRHMLLEQGSGGGLAAEQEALGILKQNGVTVVDCNREAFKKRVAVQAENFMKAMPASRPIIEAIRATSA